MKPNKLEKEKKSPTLKNAIVLLNVRQKFLNAFKRGIFPKGKNIQGKGPPSILAVVAKVSDLKQFTILTPKQML